MPHDFKATRRVEFSDTDMAGIVHFSAFFRYFETVEHSFIRSLGFSVILPGMEPPMGFPRCMPRATTGARSGSRTLSNSTSWWPRRPGGS